MSKDELADLVSRAIKAVGDYLFRRKLSKIRSSLLSRTTPCSLGSSAEDDQLRGVEDAHHREMDAKVEVRQTLLALAPELERIGEDSSNLLMLLHFIDGGGGPDNAYPMWPAIRAALQRLAIRPHSGLAGGAPRTGVASPADPFAGLRQFARGALKGQERAVVEALCDAGGELPITDLAVVDGVVWDVPFQGFKEAQRRLNPKLKPEGWRLERRNNAGCLVTLQA
jgi:hypothetical protein